MINVVRAKRFLQRGSRINPATNYEAIREKMAGDATAIANGINIFLCLT
jgi:hypothetical protein